MNRAEFLKLTALSLLSLFVPKLSANGSLQIVDVEITNEQIIIHFNQNIDTNDIKNFEISDERRGTYKRIFDIKASFEKKAIVYKNTNLQVIKVAQFQDNISRVVLENDEAINIKAMLDKNRFIIALNNTNSNNSEDNNATSEESTDDSISENNERNKKVIVIDAGHGGRDSGAVSNNKLEKDTVLDIAIQLKKELTRRGYKAYLTRDRDRFIELKDRTKIANDRNADVFISIHANATPVGTPTFKGIETYFLSPAKSDKAKEVASFENQGVQDLSYFTKEIFLNVLNHKRIIASNKLAIDTQKHILSNLGKKYKVVDGGVREGPFWVLVGALMPSILIEVGYITNPAERKLLFTPSYQNLLAEGIASGVDSYFQKNV